MEVDFGFKELYEVTIKTTQNMNINGKVLVPGETVIVFDRVQLSNFNEIKKITTANGGFDNRSLVWWETTQNVQFSLNQGVFSKEHFSMMVNAKLYNIQPNNPICINNIETLVNSDVANTSNNTYTLKYKPEQPYFFYDLNGIKINNYTINDKTVTFDQQYEGIIADYYYNYNNRYQRIVIGEELSQGYFTLQGKTRVKDDITGQVHTGLFRIPKLKLVSDLSIRLGRNSDPVVGSFDAIACPVGPKGHTKVMDMIFLSDDIDSDL